MMCKSIILEDNLMTSPIADGDMGVVIRPSGHWCIFAAETDEAAEKNAQHQRNALMLIGLAQIMRNPDLLLQIGAQAIAENAGHNPIPVTLVS